MTKFKLVTLATMSFLSIYPLAALASTRSLYEARKYSEGLETDLKCETNESSQRILTRTDLTSMIEDKKRDIQLSKRAEAEYDKVATQTLKAHGLSKAILWSSAMPLLAYGGAAVAKRGLSFVTFEVAPEEVFPATLLSIHGAGAIGLTGLLVEKDISQTLSELRTRASSETDVNAVLQDSITHWVESLRRNGCGPNQIHRKMMEMRGRIMSQNDQLKTRIRDFRTFGYQSFLSTAALYNLARMETLIHEEELRQLEFQKSGSGQTAFSGDPRVAGNSSKVIDSSVQTQNLNHSDVSDAATAK